MFWIFINIIDIITYYTTSLELLKHFFETMKNFSPNSNFQSLTLEDIAKKAGVSRNTVSLALRNSDKVAPVTKRKIQSFADILGYVPNYAARNLRIRKSGIVGLYTTDIYNAIRAQLVSSLLQALHTGRHRPVLGLGESNRESWQNSPWIRTFQELKAEAMIVIQNDMSVKPNWLDEIPVIAVTAQPCKALNCDLVGLDRTEAVKLGTEHLLEMGHKKIAIAASIGSVFIQGAITALKDTNCEYEVFDANINQPDRDILLVVDRLKRTAPPTAILAGDTKFSVLLTKQLIKANLKIPQDIAIVAYDHLPLNEHLNIPITTIEQPIENLVRNTKALLENRLTLPHSPKIHKVLKHKLVIRNSSNYRFR